MNIRLLAGPVAGVVLVLAAACGGGSAAPTAAPGGTATATRAPGAAAECTDGEADGATVIDISTNAFPPETRIAVGGTVTWTNSDIRTHDVTFRGGPKCGYLLIGASKSIQFDTPGTYEYLCQFHDPMVGKVIVE